MSDISQIDGQSVRLKRETMGWAMADMATLACLSVKQIKQIEEGGTSAFYSESVKLTAARKVAALLHMTDAQLFGQNSAPTLEPAMELSAASASTLAQSTLSSSELPSNASGDASHASLMRSEALHILAQPPEHIESAHTENSEQAKSQTDTVEQPDAALTAVVAPDHTEPATQHASGGSYMLKIFALFLVALAVAAFLRPKSMDEKSEQDAGPPPAIQQAPGSSDNSAETPAQSQPVASGVVTNMPAANDKSVDSAANPVSPEKAGLAIDKSALTPEKPSPAAANSAATPSK
jgi:transcriptional regulator with XRE-family HTH domain